MAEPWEVIEAVRNAYQAKQDETLVSFLAEDAHIIGTKHGESWTNPSDVRRALRSDFGLDQVEGQLAPFGLEPDIHIEGDIAWTVIEGRFEIGNRSHHGRWTCILKNFGDNDWKIVHSHFSVPEGGRTP
jgi:ketosteroid isomerase-like protein